MVYTGATLTLLVLLLAPYLDANENTVNDHDGQMQLLTDTCMDGMNHKSKPGPEDSLHSYCSPWSNRSCCTVQTSISVHSERMYNFDWSHCSHVKTLSDKCRKHFRQDLCFYECSPNVGPWLVNVQQKIRKQRFVNVPLCRSDCETWFRECIDDYTCTDNWGLNFQWSKNGNQCPSGSTCSTFKSVYRNNASYFCETVWDHSWKVVNDEEPCMRLWFNPEKGNPNDAVAKLKATEIINRINSGTSVHPVTFLIFISLSALITLH